MMALLQRLQMEIQNPTQIQTTSEMVGTALSVDLGWILLIRRTAVNYRDNYFRENRALTSMKVGAQPSDATMTVFTTLSSGESVPKPADPSQGSQFEVDHLLEMQNIHGAFSVMNKPNDIPQADWNAVKSAVFSKPPSNGNPR